MGETGRRKELFKEIGKVKTFWGGQVGKATMLNKRRRGESQTDLIQIK